MCRTTSVVLQLHQILRLPRYMCLGLILLTYETSFTMRGATKGSLHLYKIMRLPSKINLMIDPAHIWNVIYNARNNKRHPSNFTKYCACHEKWLSGFIRLRSETSFTMRCATRVSLQLHQILRVPRKMTFLLTHETSFTYAEQQASSSNLTKYWMTGMIDPAHIWNVPYNARRNSAPSNLTKYYACHAKWQCKIWR